MQIIQGDKVPIKAWIDGVEFEDEARQQVLNLTKLPFLFKHVALMPDCHSGKGSTIGSVFATYKAIVPASVGVDIGCFVGETRVPLLDGTQATLEELTNREEPFWVYSLNAAGEIVPGRAMSVKTRENAELIKVTVSGGDEIICTPDHEFMLNDGTYCEAQNLTFNASLMPLYRHWQTRDGYESASTGKGSNEQTHILVWEHVNGKVPESHVVNHVNHMRFDNRPENLRLMTVSSHSAHHRAVGHKFANNDPQFQRERRRGFARRANDLDVRAKMVGIGTKHITKYMAENSKAFRESVANNGKRGAPYLHAFKVSPSTCGDCGGDSANPAALRSHKKKEHSYNHKVIRIERLERRADVFCLQVEEHHNFALAAGVFVHNCGMIAQRTSLMAADLPDDLGPIRRSIEAAIPHGRTDNGQANDRGAWHNIPSHIITASEPLLAQYQAIVAKHPKVEHRGRVSQLGTLGTGNHFVEVCLDTEQRVWIMLHSGSRGVGNLIGNYFIERAKKTAEQYMIALPDSDLAYLPVDTPDFIDYFAAVEWAQNYALVNRQIMMDAAVHGMRRNIDKPFDLDEAAVNCHHNYVQREHHFGRNVIVTRKGAVSAREGQLGIIPGSMGAKSFIVRGKGNPDSFHSCSHGAGRRMSRTAAKKTFTLEDHARDVAGVECRIDADVIDETPKAYKSIDAVMAAQTDLVEIIHTLKQVLCVKG